MCFVVDADPWNKRSEEAVPDTALGRKRTCQSCSARFYDLNRAPITCPKCGATFDFEAVLKSRRPRPVADEAPKKKAVAVKATSDDEDSDELLGDDEEDIVDDDDEIDDSDSDVSSVVEVDDDGEDDDS